MPSDTVAVIIPTFNGAAVIERAVQSVQAQTVPIHEIIIVDDKSTDNTVAVVEELARKHPNIKLVHQAVNGGVSKARNAGQKHATADWIAILDADDAYRPERIEKLLQTARTLNANYVVDNMILHDLDAGVDFRKMMAVDWSQRKMDQAFYWKNCKLGAPQFSILKPMIRRDFLERSGLVYDETIGNGQDLIYQGEALALGAQAAITSEAYYIYSARMGAISGKMNNQSRTRMNFRGIADGIDALLQRRADRIDADARRHAIICRNSMRAMARINEYRGLRDYDRIASTFKLVTDPGALSLSLKKRYRKWRVSQSDYAV